MSKGDYDKIGWRARATPHVNWQNVIVTRENFLWEINKFGGTKDLRFLNSMYEYDTEVKLSRGRMEKLNSIQRKNWIEPNGVCWNAVTCKLWVDRIHNLAHTPILLVFLPFMCSCTNYVGYFVCNVYVSVSETSPF